MKLSATKYVLHNLIGVLILTSKETTLHTHIYMQEYDNIREGIVADILVGNTDILNKSIFLLVYSRSWIVIFSLCRYCFILIACFHLNHVVFTRKLHCSSVPIFYFLVLFSFGLYWKLN